jgi:anti-anti-sigma factor
VANRAPLDLGSPGPGPIRGLRLTARTAGGIAIARLSGELAIASSPVLRDELLGLLRRGSSRLVLDLSGVTACDASGLAVLVGTSHRARLLGGSLGLAALSAPAEDMLHATGLHQHLDVFPTVEAAAASVTRLRVLDATRRPAVA